MGGETSDQILETGFVEAILREELREGALDLQSGEDTRCTVSGWGDYQREKAHVVGE